MVDVRHHCLRVVHHAVIYLGGYQRGCWPRVLAAVAKLECGRKKGEREEEREDDDPSRRHLKQMAGPALCYGPGI